MNYCFLLKSLKVARVELSRIPNYLGSPKKGQKGYIKYCRNVCFYPNAFNFDFEYNCRKLTKSLLEVNCKVH